MRVIRFEEKADVISAWLWLCTATTGCPCRNPATELRLGQVSKKHVLARHPQ